jgi:beta-phosphoglucomutase-like phosphatase (HAD superfamily)
MRLAVASSSKNANAMMERIRLDFGCTLLAVFDANVCGRELERGKPDPAIFLLAARELHVEASACMVIEDAPSGVEAARAAGMTAVGIARLHDEALLTAAGANLVVTSLDQVDVPRLLQGHLQSVGRQVRACDRT